MKLCGISTSLFYLFILLKPLYLFPSGSVGVADIFLMLSFLAALLGKKQSGQGIRLFREDIPLYYVLGVFSGSHLDVPRSVFSRIYAGSGAGLQREHTSTGSSSFFRTGQIFS